MRVKTLIGLLGAGAASAWLAACAPVDPPAKEQAAPAPVPLPADAEVLTQPPTEKPDGLRDRIELAVEQVRDRKLLTTNGFWTIFHGILGLGPQVPLHDPDTGIAVNALDYIAGGGELRGLQFIPTKYGLDVQTGPQFVGQGHQDQFVAEMGQWNVPADRKFLVYGKEYTFHDFIRHTQMRARVSANQELSWAILIIGQYLGTDLEWTNGSGEKLRFEDVVRYELDAPIDTAACGGTHRLFGLSWVYHLHLNRGGKKTGVWQDVAEKTEQYKKLARKYQNGDGSFSTNFFRGPGNAPDKQLRMNTTGHILEWLALALTDAELKEPWVQDAANALSLMFLDIQGSAMEGGTLYHAVHGLLIYYARVYDAKSLGPQRPPIPLPPGQGKAPERAAHAR